MNAAKELARIKGENVNEYSISKVKGFVFVITPGHGYLALGSDDNGYSNAIEIARLSNYSYIGDDGLVLLEEDVDATKFLNLGLEN